MVIAFFRYMACVFWVDGLLIAWRIYPKSAIVFAENQMIIILDTFKSCVLLSVVGNLQT
jgi:hypothetical protein